MNTFDMKSVENPKVDRVYLFPKLQEIGGLERERKLYAQLLTSSCMSPVLLICSTGLHGLGQNPRIGCT